MNVSNYFIGPLSVVVLLFHLHGTQGANEAVVFKVFDTDKVKDILDIRYEGKWGQICLTGFDTNIADAICQQMGMTSSPSINTWSVNSSQIWIHRVECTGRTIDSCSFTSSTMSTSSSKCAVVLGAKSASITMACKPITDVHLISTGSDPHSGQVEIVQGAERGVVCYDSTKSGNLANVTCKQMGYSGGTATDISRDVKYSGKSFDVTCANGSAVNLDGCEISKAGSVCNNIQSVQCTLTNSSQITFDVRLSQSSKVIAGATSGTVEVFQYGKWGVICDTGWSISAANVVCRQLGFNGAVPTTGSPTKAKFGQGTGIVFWNNMNCSGDEASIAECNPDEVFGTGACNSVNASGVICSTEKLPQIDICDNDSTRNITGGVTFIQSTGYPTYNFVYNGSTVCKVELMSPTDFTVYIQQKMFQNNHNEYLLFETKEGRIETLYGDNSTQGPIIFNTKKLTIAFRANGAAGTGKINIMVTVPELPSTSTSTEKPGSTALLGNMSQIIDGPTPKPVNPGAIIGPVVAVVVIIAVILVIISVRYREKIREYILQHNRRDSSVRSHDDSHNGKENKGFKKSDDDQSAAPGFKGTGGTDVITETGFNTDEPKEPETGERKQNGRIGRPASGSKVKVDIDKPAFNAYELEEQPPSIGNPYEFEQPAKGSVKPWVVETFAIADNANNQEYAVVNKVKRGQKGAAFVTPNETPNPGAKPPPYVYANNLKQDIDNGNINDDSVQPADEYEEVRKPQTFAPGQSAAYADIELGAGGAPSILEQGPPVSENKRKKDKKKNKKENEKDKGDKKEAKKGEKKRGKKGDNKENKTEDKEADQKEDKKKSKGKKGDKSDGKKNAGSSDDISGLRPVGDSCAVPMSGDFSTYAEVGQVTGVGRIEPAGGSQPDESENVYDVSNRPGPNYRPGPSDPTYGVLNFQA